MFFVCVDDVFFDVDCFWYVDGEVDYYNVFRVRVWFFVFGCIILLCVVVFMIDIFCECIVDV